jgi:hypothetical protein
MSIIVRAAESVHWYRSEDGQPQYTVKAKDGSDRPTTLRDARKLNLVPSVTTVMKIAAKPGLDVWKNEQLLLAALTLPRVDGETEKEFIARVVMDSKATAKAAAERGTRVHESIEAWYEGVRPVEHQEIAKAVEEVVFEHFKTHPFQKWETEVSFSHPLGFGGKTDLFTRPDESAPVGIMLDAKTKEFGPDDEVPAYDEHLMQLAAYRIGVGMPNARCANVFASVSHPGLVKVKEWSEEDLRRGWAMFQALLNFWQLKNKFGE